ncbi:MAG: CusA/CzcA family heavy metal efflux RND transporter [Cyclobacteriaceae bacterium]|nr:CusA/CzcA family heavy metal efflux RND transporter [Cyclobacteriaceae bacterium]
MSNKLIIGLLTIGLVVWGGYSVTRLPIDAVPDITNNQVQILTVAPSQSAEDIERFVTFTVEQAMATIPGLTEMRSFSRFGLSVVTLVFTDDTDVYWARQQVSERLSDIRRQIPEGIGTPELAPVTTGLGEIYQYTLRVKPGYESKYSLTELRTIQDWIVRRQLLGTPGVADVSSFGGYVKQYEIALNPDRLRSHQLTISDIFRALERNNQNTGGTYIEKNSQAYFIRSEGLIQNENELKNLVVHTTGSGVPVLLHHVAEVRLGHAIRYGAMTEDGKHETVGAVVMMLKGENSSQVIRNIKQRIEEIQKNLPEGITIEPFLDRTKLVNKAIRTVTVNLTEGALIVIFVLVLLLGNVRAGVVVASVIPLSMLFAIGMMSLLGISGNLMSLGAIDFGLIVDGAVIIVEATLHHLATRTSLSRLTQHEMDEEVETSAKNMMNAAAFGQLIILIVYIPILTLTGVEGKMFKPMAETVMLAITGALILSLTYVPVASSVFLSKNIKASVTFSDRLMQRIMNAYRPALETALRYRKLIVAGSILLLAGSMMIFSTLGGEFLPELDEGDFAVETRALQGSSLSETIQATLKGGEVLLKNFPEVEKVVGKIGSGEIPTDPMPMDWADMMVVMKEKSEWTSASTKDELIAKMQAKLKEEVPGVSFGFQHPIQMRFNELLSGARQDVVVKIYGEDLNLLTAYAEQIGKLAARVDGARDVYVEKATGLPQVVIRFDRSRLAAYGLSVADVNEVVNAALAGQQAGLVFENERRFALVVRYAPEKRQSVEDVSRLLVTTPAGLQLTLNQVAEIRLEAAPSQIQRDEAKRRIVVGFNVRGRDMESVVNELRQLIQSEIRFTPGYYVTFGGTFKNLEEARQRLMIAVPSALLLIFVLLYFVFHSIPQGLLIFSAIPLSAIGGILSLWLRGMPFSISAGVGFIALFGISVLNGIVLVAEFNRLYRSGIANPDELIKQGTETRLRPVLMTALVASLGFLPMALSESSGAEVQRPLATVVIGGLISATALTLVVLPCLYRIFFRFFHFNSK